VAGGTADVGAARHVRRWRLVGAVCVGLEVLLGLAAVLVLLVQVSAGPGRAEGATSTANPLAVDLSLGIIALLATAGLGWCARGLLDGRAWCRGPLVTWQLVQLALAIETVFGRTAVSLSATQRWPAGGLLLVTAVLVMTALTRAELSSGRTGGGVRPPR
jgi:hypothetical protein